ncbi:threonylcarbamoyl-AMP synthase [candidate division WWE3 bacterium]|nr:threonylcarbamoyl-AMP synthase [candidate division WWE3 bacterium]
MYFSLKQDTDEKLAIAAVVETIKKGGVCLLPTDTCYILAVDGRNEHAIEKVFKIKGRDSQKPIHLNIPETSMLNTLVHTNPRAQTIVETYFPGPLTVVLNKKSHVSDLLTGGLPTLGLRMPDHFFIHRLNTQITTPYTTTSANKSGCPTPYSVAEALAQLDQSQIDTIIDVGVLPFRPTSTVVDLTTNKIKILREGPISIEQLLLTLGIRNDKRE